MLSYLSGHTRPELEFSMHKCGKYTHNPWAIHEAALKRTGQYLNNTKDKGIILTPTNDLKIDCFVDADFAGLWNQEEAIDPICVKLRTSILLTLGNVPLLWKSKLQTETALSTMESEYIALSQGMRELVSMRSLFDEVSRNLQIDTASTTRLSRVFEDNKACRKLASSIMPKLTPRSKHIAVKYHWFREHLEALNIEILPIDTKEQLTDIFTKGLTQKEFENKQRLVCGW